MRIRVPCVACLSSTAGLFSHAYRSSGQCTELVGSNLKHFGAVGLYEVQGGILMFSQITIIIVLAIRVSIFSCLVYITS